MVQVMNAKRLHEFIEENIEHFAMFKEATSHSKTELFEAENYQSIQFTLSAQSTETVSMY